MAASRHRGGSASRTRHERKRAGRVRAQRVMRALGLGLITGAADDDPSAIGTYASAGARFGLAFLWTAPVTFPMMFAVVYLSSKVGQVTGQGIFAVIRSYAPRWIMYPALIAVLIGNTIEAGADIGGMAAAINILVPIPIPWIVVLVTAALLALQLFCSYILIRNIFRWLALALLAYVGSALLARPDALQVLRHTVIPTLRFDREHLSMLVAIIGTTLSAYLYTWQSNQEVEEDVARGQRRLTDRQWATRAELRHTRRDVLLGMLFSNIIMFFIMLSTGTTLYPAGQHDIDTAAQAARALEPLAGRAAGLLFAAGVIGVGFLAVPIMTIGAAYDLSQTFGWKHGLHTKAREARPFYAAITVFTLAAMMLNFLGVNPMRALILSAIVQGFSTPPLMLLIMLITNNRRIMGDRVNGRAMNVLGWTTTAAVFAATAGLVITWFM